MSEKIVAAGWENYKGLPDGELDLKNADSLLLEGPNGSGKTSVLQVFSMLSREGEAEEPLKHGEEKGHYWLKVLKDGHEYLLRRVFNQDGRDSHLVKVDGEAAKKDDGKRLDPNKKWFRDFFNAPKFDPMGFVGKRMKDVVDYFFALTGFDGAPFDKEIDRIYQLRHEVGVRRKIKEGHVEDLEVEADDILKYKKKTDAIELSKKIAEGRQYQERLADAKRVVVDLRAKMTLLAEQKQRKINQIAEMQKEIEEINIEGAKIKTEFLERNDTLVELGQEVPDISVLEDQYKEIDRHNKMVDRVEQYQKAREEWDEANLMWKTLDDELEQARKKKLDAVLGLKFIDPNLYITILESGEYQVRYNLDGEDVPFSEGDLNTAKLIEVSIRIKLDAMRRNEEFPVIRLDCSSMDHSTIEEVTGMLAEAGVFGVLEKALGRQGVDTLQYKMIGSEAPKKPKKQSVVQKAMKDLNVAVVEEAPKKKEVEAEVDLEKMFDDDDELPF